jgi:hypothetical protein
LSIKRCAAQVENEAFDSKNDSINALTKDKKATQKNRNYASKGSNSRSISKSFLISPNDSYSNPVVELAEPKCSGKHCPNSGKFLLNVNYINMSGYFCDSCKDYLLKEGLVTITGGIAI